MLRLPLSVATALLIASVLALTCAAQDAQHNRDYWRTIAKNRYAVPANESADALAHELSTMLKSPDPELRDDLAYSILAHWIYRSDVLSTPTLLSFTDEWRANLKTGFGTSEANSVLLRSFSALCLSEMAKREARTPFLGADRYHSLLADAIAYLQAERDLRGYDAQLHWIHATAHTADLLAALADSPLLTKQEAAAILQAIDMRLSTAKEVYTQGEQDRLAAAVVSIIRRKDYDASTFDPWLAHLQEEDRDVWTATTVESLARYQNHNYLLQALTVRMLLEQEPAPMAQYREKVLAVLAKRAD